MRLHPLFILVLVLTASACTSKTSPSSDPDLLQAAEAHQRAFEEITAAQIILKELAVLSRQDGQDGLKAIVQSFKNSVEIWEKSVVEVPGMPHDHDHDHDHSHVHGKKPDPNLSSAQHLEIQNTLLQEATRIRLELEALKESLVN